MGSGNFIIIDIETTGLSIGQDQILEVAALPVDHDLNPLDAGYNVVVNPLIGNAPAAHSLCVMDPRVREMHTKNGLLGEVLPYGVSVAEAAGKLHGYCKGFARRGEIPMTGSSVHFDRKFLERDMRVFETFFHYRCIDISTLKELFVRWFPDAGEPPKKNDAHRALNDCYASLEELRWYRDRLDVSKLPVG